MLTANPTPLLMRSRSAVRPAPPGSSSSAVGARPPAGSGGAEQVRITSAKGAVPFSTCPVMSESPLLKALRSLSSTGSIPRTAASLSIWASWAKHTCTEPKPLIAPQGGLLVRTASASTTAFCTR